MSGHFSDPKVRGLFTFVGTDRSSPNGAKLSEVKAALKPLRLEVVGPVSPPPDVPEGAWEALERLAREWRAKAATGSGLITAGALEQCAEELEAELYRNRG